MIRYFSEKKTAEVALVVSNKTHAKVLTRAAAWGIPTAVLGTQEFANGKTGGFFRERGIDFLVLAGFLLKIPADVLQAYPNKIVNIHPALLPRFGGKGMYGKHVHEAVLASGVKESGITIHYVTEQYDAGGILFQTTCPVKADDTPDTLAARIHTLEYAHYPRIVEQWIEKQSD